MNNKISALLIALFAATIGRGQMVSGSEMAKFGDAFQLNKANQMSGVTVHEIASSIGSNVLWPGESTSLTFRFVNEGSVARTLVGRAEVIGYRTSVPPGDIWKPSVYRTIVGESQSVNIQLTGKGNATVTIKPKIPSRFGGYAVVFDFGKEGRIFGATLARSLKANLNPEWLPTYAMDMPWPFEMSPTVMETFRKLGVKGCRMGASFTPVTASDYKNSFDELDNFLKWSKQSNISVMLTVGAGSAPQPLGRGRPWLKPDGTLMERVKEDLAWLPAYDEEFRKWTKEVCLRYGWPKGPVNAVELWNEPWEGVSISGWGADLPRYREMYRQMALGVMDARKEGGVKVLIGGASSSSNTIDKLFPDGSTEFLPYLDFVSMHYQGNGATPCLVPMWMDRRGEYGRVKVWDTESWVANSDDRITGVVASMRSFGQDRAMGTYAGNVYSSESIDVGTRNFRVVQAWSPAAAVGAASNLLGARPFKKLLFDNGLPWIFQFDGLKSKDDGTLVVMGDLGVTYDPNVVWFRQPQAELVKKGGELKIRNQPNFRVLDTWGNVLPVHGKYIVIPLNSLGYYVRTDGTNGSFAQLIDAVKAGRIVGYPPVEIRAHDFLAPIGQSNSLRLTVTNILNRPVTGIVSWKVAGAVGKRKSVMRLAPNETQNVSIVIEGLTESPDNLYPSTIQFDGGVDGVTLLSDTFRANVIAKRDIQVDGNLDDWNGVLPQTITGAGIKASLTQEAYLPFIKLNRTGSNSLATGYLAYSEKGFYFASKVKDTTPYAGNIRFETRDDDSYYYPLTTKQADGKVLEWPTGVRKFSYRKDPDLPAGSGTDNILIAFNVLPDSEKYWKASAPGTMVGFIQHPDTDYEYALNTVAEKYGGGSEIFRLLAPGMPRKHFYPRQPKGPIDGGPVKNGKLVTKRIGDMRYTEAFIPWSEMPKVKDCLDRNMPIKFSFRVNDNDGPAYELAQGRTASKKNGLTFHNDWETHWANEIEFSFGK